MVAPLSKITVSLISDNTGIINELPSILTEAGVLEPLLNYFETYSDQKSVSWMKSVNHSVFLFLQYASTNTDAFKNPKDLFSNFSSRLYSGTIGKDGLDNTNLFWSPRSIKTTNKIIGSLTIFLDWLNHDSNTNKFNPLIESSNEEISIAKAAETYANQNCTRLV